MSNLQTEIEYMIQALDYAEFTEINHNRDALNRLVSAITYQLNRRIVHLTIKPRRSGDYVYANWTDDKGNQTAYIGKWLPKSEIAALAHSLVRPTLKDFRISDNKAKKLESTQAIWTYTLDGEGLNGSDVTFKYNRTAYDVAMVNFEEIEYYLNHDISLVAQTANVTGLKRLQSLQEDGYYIKPL